MFDWVLNAPLKSSLNRSNQSVFINFIEMNIPGNVYTSAVCDFQSMKSPVELNRLFSKNFCHII